MMTDEIATALPAMTVPVTAMPAPVTAVPVPVPVAAPVHLFRLEVIDLVL